MTKEQTFLRILAINAAIQQHLAVILEAKAMEIRLASEWMNQRLHASLYADHDSHLKASIKIHEQMIEVIEGITKVENGLAKNLKILLSSENSEAEGEDSAASESESLFDLNG